MDGLLVIDKPVGPTSHDVVARLRGVLGERRIGHTGTLDPIASGVLPLVVGRATRLARFLSASDKTYEAAIRFGVATDTYDAEGTPLGARHEGGGGHVRVAFRRSESDRVGERQVAAAGPPQRHQVRSGSEPIAQVVGERPHVEARRAVDPQRDAIVVDAKQLQPMDRHAYRGG